jgi:hypothetical protein
VEARHTENPTGKEIDAARRAGVHNPVKARALGTAERALAPRESCTTLCMKKGDAPSISLFLVGLFRNALANYLI